MNSALPHFKNEEHNFEGTSTIDRVITPSSVHFMNQLMKAS